MIPYRLSFQFLFAAAAAGLATPGAAEVRTFANPTLDGIPVSYCLANGDVCGERVAIEWCRAQGYEYASSWAATPGVDATSVTVRLDDGRVCRGAQCDAFASVTCGTQARTFRMPTLGAAGRATLISPTRRSAEAPLEPLQYQVLIPGCHQREPGVFLCETAHEYQHCRTLMSVGRVFGCRAGLAFDGDFAQAIAASPDSYELRLQSTAVATVERGQRGAGTARGEVRFEVQFDVPPIGEGAVCLQRDRYLYHATGPKGGLAEIDDTSDCGAPVSGSIVPHEDDILQAYDICDSFAAWGEEIEQPIELLAAALFHVGFANSAFAREDGAAQRIVAPYLTVRAPMQVICKE